MPLFKTQTKAREQIVTTGEAVEAASRALVAVATVASIALLIALIALWRTIDD